LMLKAPVVSRVPFSILCLNQCDLSSCYCNKINNFLVDSFFLSRIQIG